MTSPDAMRASDSDRERVVQALQEQVGEGRLTLQEFEERSGSVYEAKTVGDLRKLTADLPVDVFPRPVPPFGIGPGWQPYGMSPVPPWQGPQGPQRPVVRPGRPSPVLFVILAFIAFAVLGETFAVAAPFIIPIAVLGFVLMRVAAVNNRRGGRRYPPYR